MTDDRDDVVARSDALDEQLKEHDPVAALAARARRADRYIRLLALSLLFDLVLSVVVWRVAVQARTAADAASAAARSAATAQQALFIACQNGNEARAGQRTLWGYVLDVSSAGPPTVPRTPEQEARQREQIAQFRTYIATLFAPRNCEAEARGSR